MNKFSKIWAICVVIFLATHILAQEPTKSSKEKVSIPKVIQIDEVKVKEILKPNGKPLLVNFWATWCVPCREEFPELVEIDKEYKGKIDFITITLDELSEIERDVPQFLKEMKATMPTYLLFTNKENEVIGSISKDWAGGLPFTVLYDEKGKIVHTKQGIIKPKIVKEKLNQLLVSSSPKEVEPSVNIESKNGKLIFSGVVKDERAKDLILKEAYKTWGKENVISKDLKIDPNVMAFSELYKEDFAEIDRLKKNSQQTKNLSKKEKVDVALNSTTTQIQIVSLPKPKMRSSKEGKEDAKKDISNGHLKIKRYGLTIAIPQKQLDELKEKYGIEIVENGCILFNTKSDYFTAYNEVMKTEIIKKFGVDILKKLPL